MNYTQEMINKALEQKDLNELYFGIVEYRGNAKDIIEREKGNYNYTTGNLLGKFAKMLQLLKKDGLMVGAFNTRITRPVIITMIDDNIYDIANKMFIDPTQYKLLKYDCLTDFYSETNCRLKYFTPKEVSSLTERTILIDVDDNGKIFDAYNRAYSNPKDLVDDVTEEFIDMNRELNKQKVYSNNKGQ